MGRASTFTQQLFRGRSEGGSRRWSGVIIASARGLTHGRRDGERGRPSYDMKTVQFIIMCTAQPQPLECFFFPGAIVLMPISPSFLPSFPAQWGTHTNIDWMDPSLVHSRPSVRPTLSCQPACFWPTTDSHSLLVPLCLSLYLPSFLLPPILLLHQRRHRRRQAMVSSPLLSS